MRFLVAALLVVSPLLFAQQKNAPHSVASPATVAATIDHNRVIIDATVPLPDGSIQRVSVWVDNGNPDLYLSRHLATLLGLAVQCNDHECSSAPPRQVVVGGLTIPLSGIVKEAKIPLKPVSAAAVLAPGMNVEMNLPAGVVRHYDVLIDFPQHKFSIGPPGSIQFHGSDNKVQINAESGLIQVPSKIENKKYDLALDVGASISFLSEELFDKLASDHPTWPRMTGAVGSANMWGSDAETKWKVMRLDRLQYGSLFLTDVPVVALPQATLDFFEKRAGMPTMGLLGANSLQNYRVGIDYAHSTVYFEVGRTFNFPDFDVVGLVLRPEDDGRFTILGVAEVDGKPSVDGLQSGDHLVAVNDIAVRGITMGQVWSLLGGSPGQQRKMTIERGGKEFAVSARVQHFLPEVPDEKEGRKK